MKEETRITDTTHYEIEADCVDEKDNVVRKLGLVRGMTDNGQPGWARSLAISYRTFDEAKHAGKYASSYSVYDGHYRGGEVRILEIHTKTVTTTTTFSAKISG